MASEWKSLTLGDGPLTIIDGDRGKNYPKRSEFTESGYCLFLNAGNVTSRGFDFSSREFVSEERDRLLRKGRVQKNDIVLTTRGTVGNIGWAGDDLPFKSMRINSGMVILRSESDRLIPRFLYLVLRSKFFEAQVRKLTTGSAPPQLPIRDINRILFPIPPLPDQRRITAVLGSLDDKIELNRRMNQTLEDMAQAIFKSWFIDFDGVQPEDLVDSELGPIPRGWGVRPVTEIVVFNPSTKLKKGSLAKFVEMKGLSTSGCSVLAVGEKVLKSGGGKFLQDDTLLARITPCLENGKTALVRSKPTASGRATRRASSDPACICSVPAA